MKLVTLAISALLICSSRAQENKEKEYVENELFPKPIIELTDETLTEMHESSWSQKNIEKRQTDIPFSYLTLSQQVFNAHVRARIYPLSFSKELAAFGDLKASYLAGFKHSN